MESGRSNRAGDGSIDIKSALAIGTSFLAAICAASPFVFDLGGKAAAVGNMQKDIARIEIRVAAVESRQQNTGESGAATRATLEAIQQQLSTVMSQLSTVNTRLDALGNQQRRSALP